MKENNLTGPGSGLEKILTDFNNTLAGYPRHKTIHELFELQVSKTPAAEAAIFKGESINYLQLNQKTNQLARQLRGRGVKPGTIAAIIVERSLEMIIGIFAVLKAGGAYLPISPGTPEARISHMIRDSCSPIVLSSGKFAGEIKSGAEIINLEEADLYSGPAGNLPLLTTPRDPVYVIYTSGSTGKPKGVMIEHRSLINRLNWMQREYPLGQEDVILQKTPYVFDVSLWELFWWSLVGAKVCFMLPRLERFPQAIVETIEKNNITVMHFVPSMLNAFLNYIKDSGDVERMGSLKRVFASGEALSPVHVETFNKLLHRTNGTCLTNLYGPTEATVDVSYFDCPTTAAKIDKIPIGKPIDNTGFLIIKDNLVQPVGEDGELCISGDGLARGYLNRVELTAEQFVDFASGGSEPFCKKVPTPPKTFVNNKSFSGGPGGRFYKKAPLVEVKKLYKTGDLARWLPDGNVEFLGRIDHQVKIRGLRIELGEIESYLLNHESVKNCVVTVKRYSESMVVLVAYIAAPEDCPVKEINKYLKKYLPEYMIPNHYVTMKNLPVTATGKIDRKALPEPEFS